MPYVCLLVNYYATGWIVPPRNGLISPEYPALDQVFGVVYASVLNPTLPFNGFPLQLHEYVRFALTACGFECRKT